MPTSTNKRIAKNSLVLYFRMAIMLGVSLLTSRVVLDKLGIQDFGVYDIVCGIIAAFSFLFSSMSLASQRFITYELGKKETGNIQQIFSMSINVQICIAVTILVLAETLGLWFLNTYLNIPSTRIIAANWVYQFAIFSTILSIWLVPYNAIIIAHEKMGFYAWASIINVSLRLIIVYLLVIGNYDKLIFYGFLGAVVSIIMQVIYISYCKAKFKTEVHYSYKKDPALFKEIFSFSGWCLLGGTTSITKSQGISIILNMFLGVTVNAAMGIANRVADAVNQFVTNFQTAANPQIIKQYAAREIDSLSTLIFRVSKFSYCLMLLFILPLFLNTNFILQIWLVNVPTWTSEFVKLSLLFILIDSLAGPQWMSILATGKIKNYYIIETAITLCNIPLCIILLYRGYPPLSALICKFGINVIVLIWRSLYMSRHVGLSFTLYFKKAIFPLLWITPLSAIAPIALYMNIPQGWLNFVATSGLSIISVTGITWLFGLDTNEKNSLKKIIIEKLSLK